MAQYLIRQTLLSLVKLFVFITLMFFLIQIVMPFDFVDQFAQNCNAACREALREQLGLDLPITQRYFNWLGQIVRFDLGRSLRQESIADVMTRLVPATLLVVLPGTAIAFVIGLVLGKFTAWRGRGLISGGTTFASIAFFTSFPPWLAFLVAYAFSRTTYVQRSIGFNFTRFPNTDPNLWLNTEMGPHQIATQMLIAMITISAFVLIGSNLLRRYRRIDIPGFLQVLLIFGGVIGSWYLFGISELAFDLVDAASVAIVTYILLSFGETMLIMRSSMTEVMTEEYVNVAKAKGLPTNVVRDRHAARNALLPVLSRLVISLPYLLTGIVIIEDALTWPGIGTGMMISLYWQDIPFVMSVMLIVGIISLIARLVLDVIAAYMDPRIRFSEVGTY
ncbi:MAG: ABC transporter permease [Chloroflexi bacterium]|nr:MAG: ABC transporter permease [Chloroflexota bacterium]MBL1197278.1 ABC transporter permease [Chloroflexota bacterium]NOH14573.1 ABC transporter permease [Chloroflexota bacterium]